MGPGLREDLLGPVGQGGIQKGAVPLRMEGFCQWKGNAESQAGEGRGEVHLLVSTPWTSPGRRLGKSEGNMIRRLVLGF